MKRTLLSFSLAVAMAVPLGLVRPLARAQDATPPGPPPVRKLVHDEKAVKDAVERLGARMRELAKKIREKQPDEAKRLDDAWKVLHDRLIAEDVQKVIECLESGDAGLFKAIAKEKEVQQELREVLEILERQQREDQRDLDTKIASLKEAVKKVDELKKREEEHKRGLEQDRGEKADLQNIEEAKKALQALEKEQEKLKAGESSAEAQRALEKALEDAAAKAQALARKQRDIAGRADRAGLRALEDAARSIDALAKAQEEAARETEESLPSRDGAKSGETKSPAG